MSFSVIREPATFCPAYNQMTWRVYSSNYIQPQMKYIFYLYLNGTTLINTSKMYPRPDGYCEYDPSKIIRSYLTSSFMNDITAGTIASSTEVTSFTITCAEEYIYSNVLTTYIRNYSNYKYVWMAAADWEDGKDLTAYMNKFLPQNVNYLQTNAANYFGPRTYLASTTFANAQEKDCYDIQEGEKRVLSFMARNEYNYNCKVAHFCVAALSRYGLKLYSKNIKISSNTNMIYQIYNVPVGTAELNAIGWTSAIIPGGASSTITASEDIKYFVWFSEFGGNLTHKIMGFNLKSCNRWEKYTVMYQAPNGGWWYIPMNLKNAKTENVKQSTMDTFLRYNYDKTDAVTKVTSVLANGEITLTSDWILTKNQSLEFMDMVKSPRMYIMDGSNYIPVIIKAGNFDTKNPTQDRLVNYTITFQEAFDKNSTI